MLGVTRDDYVAHIKVGTDIWALEIVDEVSHLEAREEKPVPDVLQRYDYPS